MKYVRECRVLKSESYKVYELSEKKIINKKRRLIYNISRLKKIFVINIFLLRAYFLFFFHFFPTFIIIVIIIIIKKKKKSAKR